MKDIHTFLAQFEFGFNDIYILFAILAFPSLIAMLTTLTINVIERTQETGLIRAVGGTRRQIRNPGVAESLLLAAIGATFGIVAATVIGLLFGVLAASIPARQATRLEIIQALRYE